MTPPFDLQGGIGLAIARAVSVGAVLSLFGTLTFECLVARAAYARMQPQLAGVIRRRLDRFALVSLLCAAAASFVWLVLEAGQFADADSLEEYLAAIRPVLLKTVFGHIITAQSCALAIVLALLVARGARGKWDDPDAFARLYRWAALIAALAGVVLQAGHSHAYAMSGGISLLLVAEILHLVGAGAWLGGLAPLLLLVRAAPAKAGATAARWFSPMGKWCIAALAASAAYQGWVMVASIPGLLGTAYGWLMLAKIMLAIVLLGFAAANRYRFAPALLGDGPVGAKRLLLRSIALQTGFAAAIILAAAILSGLPPSMHEQARWPFPRRFSLTTIDEDPALRREVLLAAAALGVATLVLLTSILLRKLRLLATAVAAVTAWFAVPHLELLLVEAFPTSFYHSPTDFASASIVAGASIYARNCAGCHGERGQGDGPGSRLLSIPPADLTAAHLWMHSDGELFWWITHGMEDPDGLPVMPGFAARLDEDQRWAVIDFIRANNVGAAMRLTGSPPHPTAAPGFEANCAGTGRTLSDLRGNFVRLVFGALPQLPAPAGLVTVVVAAGKSVLPAGSCSIDDETVPVAYAIVSGLGASSLPEAQFLIDDHGTLRAVQPAAVKAGWNTKAGLATEMSLLRAHPVPPASSGEAMSMKMPGEDPR